MASDLEDYAFEGDFEDDDDFEVPEL